MFPNHRTDVFTQVNNCAKRDEMLVLLSSKLPHTEQLRLAELGKLLEGKVADAFSGSGTGFPPSGRLNIPSDQAGAPQAAAHL